MSAAAVIVSNPNVAPTSAPKPETAPPAPRVSVTVLAPAVLSTIKINSKPNNSAANVTKKDSNSVNSFYQLKKSPRELAIVFKAELKKLREKYKNYYLVRR